MFTLQIPEWLSLLGLIAAFGSLGWNILKEVRQYRLAQRMRISATVVDCRGGHVVTIRFDGAEDHTVYEADVVLVAPRAAHLSYGQRQPRQSGAGFIAGSETVPDTNLGRRAQLLLDKARGLPTTARANDVVLVGTASQQRATLAVTIVNKGELRRVTHRRLKMFLD